MKNAVIYARFSSHAQNEQSIEGQLAECYNFAQRNDLRITHEYIDRALTGTTDKRPEFLQMIEDSKRKGFQYVLVYQLDRFASNRYDSATYKAKLKKNGVRVLSAKENITDDASGILIEGVLESMAEYYSVELSQKVKRGIAMSAAKCKYFGGVIPLGYKVNSEKSFVLDEELAPVVKTVFEMFVAGSNYAELIRYLNGRGVKTTKGGEFNKNSFQRILSNRRYLGKYIYQGNEIDGGMPRIIDDELFGQAKQKLALYATAPARGKAKVEYILSEKLKCGYCGNNINGEYAKSHTGADFYYYKCRGRKMKLTDCNKSTIQKDTLENLIIDFTVEQLSEPQNIEAIINNLLAIQERNLKVNSTLIALQKEQREIETAIDNTMKAIAQGVITKTTTQYLKQYEERQEEITKLIVVEQSKETVTITEKEIRKYYQDALRLEPQMLVNYLIKEITLFDNRADIYYNSPIKSTDSPDNSQGFSFYSKSIRLGHKLMIVTLFIR